ncbi:MAG: hypothetical protein LBV12_10430 [Puniceicoccales bacterium]|nr:hypothetical protein [Puniceicoccales bacterium]
MKKNSNKPARTRRSFTLRERALFAAFVWAIVIIAAGFIFKQYRAAKQQEQELATKAQEQDLVLNEKESVEERLAAHISRMESAETLVGSTLQGLIDSLARQSNLIPEAVTPKTENKSGIEILSVRLTFRDATMERLLVFDDKVRSQRVPLSITRIRLDAGRNDTLNVAYDVATYHLREKNR